jgi:hypothetical protein
MRTKMILAVLLVAALLVLPVCSATAQLVQPPPPSDGGDTGHAPELPIGALSLLVAVGAGAIIGGRFLKKKKKGPKDSN